MIQKIYKKKEANEICRRLKNGLGFSCKIVLIKRTSFSLRGRKYIVKTDAPKSVINDIIITI